MKHPLLLLFSLSLLLFSCDKQTTDAGPSTEPGVQGQFIATRSTRIVVLDDDTMSYATESAMAFLYEKVGVLLPYRDAGTIAINGEQMTQDANHLYTKEATSLNMSDGCLWYGPLVISSRPLNFKDTTAFPEYLATLPYEVNKAAGLSIHLNNGVFTNTDSVRIYISDGSSNPIIEQQASVTKDSIYFPPAMLAPLATTNMHTGVITVAPYRGMIKTLDNHVFFFTKETRIVQSINIY